MVSQQNHSHRANQTTSARPLPRVTRPRFMSLDAFQLTPELLAEIDAIVPGMSGVAYAGGAMSGPVSKSPHLACSLLPKESTLGLAYSRKRPIPRGSGESPTGVQSRNTSSCDKNRDVWELYRRGSLERDPPQRIPTHQPSPNLEVTEFPKCSDSLSDPGDHDSYKLNDRELLLAQASALSPNPPVPSQNQCTDPLRSAPHSVARISDNPIHEESEEHCADILSYYQGQERDRQTPDECEDEGPAHGHGQGRGPGGQVHAASPPTASSDLVAEYYTQSPMASHSRPGAPIPPTTHSYTTTMSHLPSPLISGVRRTNGKKPILPPYTPVRVDSPYPYPFGHIRRKSDTGTDETMGLSQMDPNVVLERHLRLQAYALNNASLVSDSTLSPSSKPLKSNPWTFLQTSRALSGTRGDVGDSQASTRSSPSHQPLPLPTFGRGRRRSTRSHRQSKTRLPPRVESTQPRDTSPELSSTEKTAKFEPQQSLPQPTCADESADDSDETNADDEKWINEDVGLEGVAGDLLQLEFHPNYVGDPEKRRRRWQHRWETILHNFRALDRETNTALVLLAAPAHTAKLHSVASRAVRRDSSLKSTDMKSIRSAFARISSRQHTTSTASLLEQLSQARLSSRDGSSSSSRGACEKDLRRALDTAFDGLHALGTIYEQREMRWTQEKLKLDEDKEKVQLVLKQVLGASIFGTVGDPATPT